MITNPTDGPESIAVDLSLGAADIRRALGDDLAVLAAAIGAVSTVQPKIHKLLTEAVDKYGDNLVASALDFPPYEMQALLSGLSSDNTTATETPIFLEDL